MHLGVRLSSLTLLEKVSHDYCQRTMVSHDNGHTTIVTRLWCHTTIVTRLCPGGGAAATAAAEELSTTSRLHPIMRRYSIRRSGNPSLRYRNMSNRPIPGWSASRIYGKIRDLKFRVKIDAFFDFLRYGSWRPLDVTKTMSEDVRTFCTTENLILRT